MGAQKKNVKNTQQPDLFGVDTVSPEGKEKLRELLERLKKAQELLAANS